MKWGPEGLVASSSTYIMPANFHPHLIFQHPNYAAQNCVTKICIHAKMLMAKIKLVNILLADLGKGIHFHVCPLDSKDQLLGHFIYIFYNKRR